MLPAVTAQHCTLHNTALCTIQHCKHARLSRWRRRVVYRYPPPDSSSSPFTAYASSVHGACKSTKQNSLAMPATNRRNDDDDGDDESPPSRVSEPPNGAYEQCCSCLAAVGLRYLACLRLWLYFCCSWANGLLFLFLLLFAVVFCFLLFFIFFLVVVLPRTNK